MTFSGNLAEIGLADVFQNIHSNRLTGTLIVTVSGGQRFTYFVNGLVTRFSLGVNKGLAIGPHLAQRQYVTEQGLERARRRKAKHNCTLRAALQALDLMQPEEFTAAASELIQEQLYDMFSAKQAEFTFQEGKPPARVFDREQATAGITVDPSAILMEGARRLDEFSRIHQVVTDDRDIFVSLEGWDEVDLEDVQRDVADLLDGRTEVGALLHALPYSRFVVLKAINDLVRFDLARPLTGRELEDMAQEALGSGEPDDAIALLQRALMIERSNTEMRIQLAELLEQTGRSGDASTEYAALGYQEAQSGEIERAIEYYERATDLRPEDIGVHSKQVELMARIGHGRYADELLGLNDKLLDAGMLDKALANLVAARSNWAPADRIDLESRIAEVEEQLGHDDEAAQIYRHLAKQVASTDKVAHLDYLRRAAELRPQDAALRAQVDDLESGRTQLRRRRRQFVLRIAALVVVSLGTGIMGLMELVASHRIISGLQHVPEGRTDSALRRLRDVHTTFGWTLAGQRAGRLAQRVFDGQLEDLREQLERGDLRAALATARPLQAAGMTGENQRRLEVTLARADRMVRATELFARINRPRPDESACIEYSALTVPELTAIHLTHLAMGENLRPRALRILLNVLERIDDPSSLAPVARAYLTLRDSDAVATAEAILAQASHHALDHGEGWASVRAELEAAAEIPETTDRARQALIWLRVPASSAPPANASPGK